MDLLDAEDLCLLAEVDRGDDAALEVTCASATDGAAQGHNADPRNECVTIELASDSEAESLSAASAASAALCCLADADSEEGTAVDALLEADTEGAEGDASSDEPLLHTEPESVGGASCSWRPGEDCGDWLGTLTPLGEQGQVLVGNAAVNMRRCAVPLRKELLLHLNRGRRPPRGRTAGDALVGALLGVSPSTVSVCLRTLELAGWRPSPRQGPRPPSAAPVSASTPAAGAAASDQALESEGGGGGNSLALLVRLALANAYEGRSGRAYERDVARLVASGVQVGNRHTSRHFCRDVEHLASQVLREHDAVDWHTPLASLGIPSDFGVLIDPVSIGSASFARHDTLLMTALPIVSPHTRQIHTPMAGGLPMAVEGHTGGNVAALTLRTLAEHPASLGLAALRARCAVVCGDGQVVLGGPAHRHSSTQAAEKLWKLIHGDETPLRCTLWDPFHRTDTACSRAVRASAAAQEVFAMAQKLDHLFGVGEGRVLLHAVATQTGQRAQEVRAPGGTRKVVYLSGVPGNVVRNYAAYTASLHARIAWRQQGHGTQTLAHLTDVGRRLQDLRFVAFTVLLDDVLRQVVRPYALMAQTAVEPWISEPARHRMHQAIDEAAAAAVTLKRLLMVTALCRQHLHGEEVLRFLSAFSVSSLGRSFPSLFLHVASLLGTSPATFQGCTLQRTEVQATGHQVLGPHCQCVAVDAFWQQERRLPRERRVEVQMKVRGDLQRAVRVPLWVAVHSAAPAMQWDPGRSGVVRWQTRSCAAGQPHGVPNLFRRGLRQDLGTCCRHAPLGFPVCPCRWTSRCQVPAAVYEAHRAMAAAVSSMQAFLESLREEMVAVGGDVGVSAEMQELLAVAGKCWDWSFLVGQAPQAEHVRAFMRCLGVLRPFLSHTLWPDPQGWPGVRQAWDATDADYARQYLCLLKRVRAMWQQQGAAVQSWGQRASWVVRPAWVFSGILQLVQAWVRSRRVGQETGACKRAQVRAAVLLSQHLGVHEGHTLPRAAFQTLRVSRDSLRPPRLPSRLHKKQRVLKANRGIAQEGMSVLTGGEHAGKLVVLLSASIRINGSAVSESIDRDKTLVFGSCPRALVVWHAARVHHRCRLLAVPTAACERLGSFLHQQWDAMQGTPATMLADRVLLVDGKVACVGAPRDEAIILAVCQQLPEFSTQREYAPVRQVQQLCETVEKSGREPCAQSVECARIPTAELRLTRRQHLRQGVPSSLPVALEEAVAAADRGGRLAALPLDVWAVRHPNATHSVAMAHLEEWQRSDEGGQWSDSRAAVFQEEGDAWSFLAEEAVGAEKSGNAAKRHSGVCRAETK